MKFSIINIPPEQCAILPTFWLYLFSYSDSLFYTRQFASSSRVVHLWPDANCTALFSQSSVLKSENGCLSSLLLWRCRFVCCTDAALKTTDTTWFVGRKLNILTSE